MKYVWILYHTHMDDIKICGVFSKAEKAGNARVKLAEKPGFRDLGHFHTDKYEINDISWTEGFTQAQ